MSERREYLTPERIASSQLGELLFRTVRAGEVDDDEIADVFALVVQTFANGRCFWLASALALETEWPVAGLFRDGGDHLAHSVLVRPDSLEALDVFGGQPFGELRAGLTQAVGPVRIERLEPIQLGTAEREALLTIAAMLPWLPWTGRERPTFAAWAALLRAFAAGSTPS